MRKLLLLIAVLLCSIGMFAQPRSEEQAKQIASEFFNKKPQQKAPMLSVVPQQKVSQIINKKMARAKASPAQHSACYIINDDANNRFVIVSTDERMYNILGYSYNGTFDADSLPQGLMDMLYGYNIQYDYLIGNANPSHNYKAKRKTATVVEPLIKSKWNQRSPYNDQCPEENVLGLVDMRTVTGCVATAMAQVMNFHQYPSRGQGYTSYTTSTNISQSMYFSSVNFDWTNMANIYDDSSSETQKNAVAELMHACGVSVHMDYSWLESGAYSQDMAYALINYFKYNPNIKYYERRYFSKDNWEEIIQEDLTNGRPILYSGMGEGKTSDGTTYKYGHQFILDGCDAEGKYHFNFGWGGKFDGYFELTAITPEENSDFTLDQAMVCNVSPQAVGKHEDIFFATAVLYDKTKINVGSYASATFDPHCACVETNSYGAKFNGEFGIGVFDVNKNFVKSLYRKSENRMSTGSYYESLNATMLFDRSTFIDGATYYIAPYAKSNSSSEYTWMRTTYGLWDYYIATVSDGVVTLGRNPLPIPTGRVYASAFDINNSKKEWQFTLTQDPDEERVYWFDGFDPALSGSENHVKGTLDDFGTQIHIKIGQSVGNGMTITNYSSPGDILVSVSAKDSVMSINGAWGTLKMKENGDNISLDSYSQYSLTEMSFKYVPVVAPAIIFNKTEQTVSMACGTEGASIYYTTDGTKPTISSNLYSSPISVIVNCTIKAIAVKNGEQSEVVELVIKDYTVEKPVITVVDETHVTLTCSTMDSDIYYTTDNSLPTTSTTRVKYESTFDVEGRCTIKAIGVKDGYNDSEISETYVIGPILDSTLVVNDNVAGKLEERVGTNGKVNTKELIVSGQLNGTDIALIRDMIDNYNLSVLNIANADIVSGGDPYYKTKYSQEITEDNIVGENMFYNCKNLAKLELPSTATTIKMFAISGCELLQELSIPCKTINGSAIRNCKNLESVTLTENVKVFDGDNFDGCSKLISIKVESTSSDYMSEDGVLYSKDGSMIVKYPMGRTDKTYDIKSSVKIIGKEAFSNAKLEQVSIPESTITIESSAFEYCRNLTAIQIPDAVTNVGYMAFWGCSQLGSVTISSELSKIEASVFYNCVNLREFTISKGICEISSSAFENCTSLQKFRVDEENRWFASENGVLYSYNMATLVRCPLAYYAEIFRVPDGVLTIADEAFSKCVNIGKIILPESVTEIGNSAFSYTNITAIDIPSSVKEIGSMAFWGCKQLETFIIPLYVNVIPSYMMYNCSSLKYLEIPEDVVEIKSAAFSGCKSLQTIKCDITNINSLKVEQSYDGSYDIFKGIPNDCTWRVPFGPDNYIDKYAKEYVAQPWWVSSWNTIPMIGDINNDGRVDIADAVSILNLMAESTYDEKADINNDNKIDIADFVTVLNIMAGK